MIHSIASIQAERPDDYPPQVIPFPKDLGARCLSSNPYGILIPHHERDEKMRIVSIPLMTPSQRQARTAISASRLDEASTPPTDSTASDQSRSLLTLAMQRTSSQSRLPLGPFTTTIAETLLVMTDSIVAIAALAWIIKAEQLLDAGKTEECVRLVEEERRKSKRGEIDGDRVSRKSMMIFRLRFVRLTASLQPQATHSADLRYIHTRLALTYLKETLFEDAIALFTRAKTDPRVVCRMFPDFVGNAIQPEDELQIWQGLEEAIEHVPDLETISEWRTLSLHETKLTGPCDQSLRLHGPVAVGETSSLTRLTQRIQKNWRKWSRTTSRSFSKNTFGKLECHGARVRRNVL